MTVAANLLEIFWKSFSFK